MAPRPILKIPPPPPPPFPGIPGTDLSSSTTSTNSLTSYPAPPTLPGFASSSSSSPCHSHSRGSLHVHFPPTPALACTETTHSPNTYDRAPIVVLPNDCEIPGRGCRSYYGDTSTHTHRRTPPKSGKRCDGSEGDGDKVQHLIMKKNIESYFEFHPRALEANHLCQNPAFLNPPLPPFPLPPEHISPNQTTQDLTHEHDPEPYSNSSNGPDGGEQSQLTEAPMPQPPNNTFNTLALTTMQKQPDETPRKGNRRSLATRNRSQSRGGNGTGDSDDRECLTSSSYTPSYTPRWSIGGNSTGAITSAFSGPALDGCLGGF